LSGFHLCLSVLICAYLWIQPLRRAFAFPRRRLALWTVVAASSRHDHTADDGLATKTRLAVTLINAVPELETAALPLGINVV
jgi:hypothetical protein